MYSHISPNILTPKLDTAAAVRAKIPGVASVIIQSVTFIVVANNDSKNETTGLLISPINAKAEPKIITKIKIGTKSPFAKDSTGFLGIKFKHIVLIFAL